MAPAFAACVHSLGARGTLIRCSLCPQETAEHRSLYRQSVITS
ncbi:unnamed protein product [Staurois parvus]|uniref:Uncharacterized protein n=1 Tax=Staurois parvus TaxID=386267 RepID=A0ABN9A6L3_9NEOB|nr:unnamed protein product [Staurois parvus]